MNKSIVPFWFLRHWARTISGEEEGAFAWISANYGRGFFQEKDVQDYGVVEMGGASLQVKID
jgi:apyrase